MKKAKITAVLALATLACSASTARAVTVFNDTFATSTLNDAAPAAPTATSTDYAVVSSKNATSSTIAAGSLKPRIGTTSSGLNEVQARFRSSPITLAADNDFIEMSATFVPTGLLYTAANTSATLGFGLYNTHGVTPIAGGALNNGLLGNDTTYVTGGAAGWDGYATKFRVANNAEIYTRAAQSGATNANQDLVFRSGVTGGFNTPPASQLAAGTPAGQLTDGSTYTYTLKIAVTPGGVGTLDITQNLYSGVDTTGANLLTHTATTSVEQTIATAFDGLAFGYRATNDTTLPATEHSLNISRITIDTNVAVPVENANFDGLGQVDGNDFLKWQQGLGLTGQTTNANGDANGSGVVDGADLGIWKGHFGQATTVAAASAVPEPAGVALVIAAVLTVGGFRRRR
jgi:hypothetical protein